MEEFSKMVEAYRWRGDAVIKNPESTCASVYASPAIATPCNEEDDDIAAGSTHKKGGRGASSSSTPSLLHPYDVRMHKIEPNSSVSDDNKDVGSLSFSTGWYRPGQQHLLMKKSRGAPLRTSCSSRQLVFSVEDMDAKVDAEGSVQSKVKSKNKRNKKRRRTEKKRSDKQARSKQGGIEACNMPDFYEESECEDGALEFCSPDVAYSPGLVSQQSHFELVSRKSKGRSATSSNCVTRHVSMNGKSPFFTHSKRTVKDNTVKKGKKASANMLISKPENRTAAVKTYTPRSKKEGPVGSKDVITMEGKESSDLKIAEDQSANPFKEAVLCLESRVIPRKAISKAKTSAYFTTSVKALGQRDIVNKTWVPPVSVHALIQEELYQDPWKVLVACMLLNKTSGTQMRRVIWDLFSLCPTPEAAVAVETYKIEDVIRPLGLQKKRAHMIQKFSKDYLGKEWINVGELHGIGKYATDAYAIFCEGRWREVKPEDHKLNDYWKYLCDTEGLGYAFKDDRRKIDEVAPSS